MKQIAIALLIGWGLSSAQAATPDFSSAKLAGFEKTEMPVWVHQDKKNYVVTATVLDGAWFELKESGVQSYLEKLETTRSTVNFFAGIKEWKITGHSFKTENNRAVLVLHGKYMQGQQETHFTEMQTFAAPHIYQVKVSSQEQKDISETESDKVFKSFTELIP